MQILFWVSEGSTLEPLLFNIFLCNLFVIMNKADFASYADGRTPYTIGNEIEDVIQRLHPTSKFIFFSVSRTKKWRLINADKYHFICSFYQKTNLTYWKWGDSYWNWADNVGANLLGVTYRGKGFLTNIVWFGACRKY